MSFEVKPEIKLGVSGSRHGMNAWQARMVDRLWDVLVPWLSEIHHGDCVGCDVEMVESVLAKAVSLELTNDIQIVAWPPTSFRFRALLPGDQRMPPQSYRQRNQSIVDACDVLVACPGPDSRGTWMTVRMAADASKPMVVLCPDKTVVINRETARWIQLLKGASVGSCLAPGGQAVGGVGEAVLGAREE